MLAGLDLADRAVVLGISCRAYVQLAESDPRIFDCATTDTAAAIVRLRRWLAAGSPPPDLAQLSFIGDDSARAVVIDVLRTVPAAVGWHGAAFVSWIEVGRSAVGWQDIAPPFRAPPAADVGHMIALSGDRDDAALAIVAAHELGHSWHRGIHAAPPPRLLNAEHIARHAAALKHIDENKRFVDEPTSLDIERATKRIVRGMVSEERRADRSATAWGYTRGTDEARNRQWAQTEVAAAIARFTDIEAQIDADLDDTQGAPP